MNKYNFQIYSFKKNNIAVFYLIVLYSASLCLSWIWALITCLFFQIWHIFQGEPVTYTGNPLEDFTTIRFLDRFVYKNPKKRDACKLIVIYEMKKKIAEAYQVNGH